MASNFANWPVSISISKLRIYLDSLDKWSTALKLAQENRTSTPNSNDYLLRNKKTGACLIVPADVRSVGYALCRVGNKQTLDPYVLMVHKREASLAPLKDIDQIAKLINIT